MAKQAPPIIEQVKRAVQEQFPDLVGVEPTISETARSGSGQESQPFYVLTFRQDVELEDGGHMTHIVRITANQAGEIVKLTASR